MTAMQIIGLVATTVFVIWLTIKGIKKIGELFDDVESLDGYGG